MPVYAYMCGHCEDVTDLRRPVDLRDAPLECLECGNDRVRIFTPEAVLWGRVEFLKEHGFFDTTARDYNPTPEERPDLYRLEERRFAGWRKGEE